MKPKSFITAAFVAISLNGPAKSYDHTQDAMNSVSAEMVTCAAYFMLVSRSVQSYVRFYKPKGQKLADAQETARGWEDSALNLMQKAILMGEVATVTKEATWERYRLAWKDMFAGLIKRNWSNMPIATNKYQDQCIALNNDLAKALTDELAKLRGFDVRNAMTKEKREKLGN